MMNGVEIGRLMAARIGGEGVRATLQPRTGESARRSNFYRTLPRHVRSEVIGQNTKER